MRQEKLRHLKYNGNKTAYNSTFVIGGVSYSADSFVGIGNLVLRMNNCGEKPAHRKSANRYVQV